MTITNLKRWKYDEEKDYWEERNSKETEIIYMKQKRRQRWKNSKKGKIIRMEEPTEKWDKLKRNW